VRLRGVRYVVSWAHDAFNEGEFDEADLGVIRDVVARLGLADVAAFGLALFLVTATLRLYTGTAVGDKHLCVIVKHVGGDACIVTAYLTDRVKRGVMIWPKEL
jgi:hypothetical protein